MRSASLFDSAHMDEEQWQPPVTAASETFNTARVNNSQH